jgi:4-amino-4-deoxy-L-arabinose transferase-like glycosyltransferase
MNPEPLAAAGSMPVVAGGPEPRDIWARWKVAGGEEMVPLPWLPAIAITLVVLGFLLFTVRSGHIWGDDFAQYILHARNLAEGRSYSDTGYLFNSAHPYTGPPSYPPGAPLLLTVAYWWGGLNLTPYKAVQIAVFALSLLPMYWLVGWRVGAAGAALVTLLVGLNPLLWESKDVIGSDLPFVTLVYLALWIAVKMVEGEKKSWILAVALALVIALAGATRITGIVLVPAIGIYAMWRRRFQNPHLWVALSVAAVCFIVQNVLMKETLAGYGTEAQQDMTIASIVGNVHFYLREVIAMFLPGGLWFARVITLLVLASAGIGLAVRVARRGPGLWEIFAVLYLVPVIAHPNPGGFRYLWPLVPLVLTYSYSAFRQWRPPVWARLAPTLGILLLFLIGVNYARGYSQADFSQVQGGIPEDFLELSRSLRANTSVEDRFLFRKPKALALFADREASAYHRPELMPELAGYIRDRSIDYAITAESVFPEDRGQFVPYLRHYPECFAPEKTVGRFMVWRVHAGCELLR